MGERRAPLAKASLWTVAAVAFMAMCLQDLLATGMVIFESHFDAAAAGLMDVAGYLATLTCSVLALESILTDGWRTRRSLTIVAAVSVANFAGTYAGVAVGAALTHH